MLRLIGLVRPLIFYMVLAVTLGVAGHLCAVGITIAGGYGLLAVFAEGAEAPLHFIAALMVVMAILRGLLRYGEQLCNHFLAFKLLALIRDRVFRALRRLCPAKLEGRDRGDLIAMITSDIELLEVFYAHTISPICIAVLVSTAVFLFVGFVSSWYLALVALAGFLTIGIVVPLISSGKLKESGVKYRAEFASFSAYFLDSIKGIKDIVLNNAGEEREKEVNRRSDGLLKETKKMKHNITCAGSAIELMVSVFVLITLAVGILLVKKDVLSLGRMIIGMVTVFSSFGPVIAVGSLPGNLTQTFASGDRVLNLLAEKPAVEEVKNGKNIENELEESAQTLQKLYVSINDYLASMYSEGVLTEEQASQSAGVLYVLCDIDRIGILLNEIVNTISVENKSKHKYSKDALKELRKAMAQIHEIYTASIRAISGDGSMDIEALQKQKDEVMALDERLRKNHITRVGKGKCDSKLTAQYNEMLHNIDRIGNSCVNLVEVANDNVTMQSFFIDDDDNGEVRIA